MIPEWIGAGLANTVTTLLAVSAAAGIATEFLRHRRKPRSHRRTRTITLGATAPEILIPPLDEDLLRRLLGEDEHPDPIHRLYEAYMQPPPSVRRVRALQDRMAGHGAPGRIASRLLDPLIGWWRPEEALAAVIGAIDGTAAVLQEARHGGR